MNRIYQGKVIKPGGNSRRQTMGILENDIWQKQLREQHKTFQDGVNYYFVAACSDGRRIEASKRGRQAKRNWNAGRRTANRKSAKGKKAKRSDEEKKKDERDRRALRLTATARSCLAMA